MAACCRPTVPCASVAIGFPATLKYPCARATDDSSWQHVMNSGARFPPWLMSDSCRPRKLEPGFAATYSRSSVFRTSTMKSPPGRSVVSTSTAGDGSLSRGSGGTPGVAGRASAGVSCAAPGDAPVATTAAPVTAACFRNLRRPTDVLRMPESLHPGLERWDSGLSSSHQSWVISPEPRGPSPEASVSSRRPYEDVVELLRFSYRIRSPFQALRIQSGSRRRCYEDIRTKRADSCRPVRHAVHRKDAAEGVGPG